MHCFHSLSFSRCSIYRGKYSYQLFVFVYFYFGILCKNPQWARKFKKGKQTPIDFWPILKLQKMEFGKKKIREIDFTCFYLAWTFFKFSGPLHCGQLQILKMLTNLLTYLVLDNDVCCIFVFHG